jgi:uncharacterized protein YwgA
MVIINTKMEDSTTRLKTRIVSIFEKVVGRSFDMSKFQDRFLMQKITLLAQRMGLGTNFNFSPYIYGPYSTELTSLVSDILDIQTTSNLIGEDSQIAEKIISYFGDEINEYKSRDLEVISTLAYYQQYISDEKKLFDRVRTYKPWATDELMKSTLEKLSQ